MASGRRPPRSAPLPPAMGSATHGLPRGKPRAPVAQLDRALPSEGRGHRFESCRVRQTHNTPEQCWAAGESPHWRNADFEELLPEDRLQSSVIVARLSDAASSVFHKRYIGRMLRSSRDDPGRGLASSRCRDSRAGHPGSWCGPGWRAMGRRLSRDYRSLSTCSSWAGPSSSRGRSRCGMSLGRDPAALQENSCETE